MRKKMIVLMSMVSVTVGAVVSGMVFQKIVKLKAEKVDKFKNYYNMLDQWLILKQEGKPLDQYFINNSYKTIAIYGMGEMGNRLYDELKNSEVKVAYAIDKNASEVYSELKLCDIDDDLDKVDAVVVTATFAFNEIKEKISEKIDCPIISLEDVVYES